MSKSFFFTFIILSFVNSLKAQEFFYIDGTEADSITVNDIATIFELSQITDYDYLFAMFGGPIMRKEADEPGSIIRPTKFYYDGFSLSYVVSGDDLLLELMEIIDGDNFVRFKGKEIRIGDNISIFKNTYPGLYKNPRKYEYQGEIKYSYTVYFKNGGTVYFDYDDETKKITKMSYFQLTH